MPLTELTSDRLRLRAFVPADAPAVHDQVRHREISDWTSSIPHPYSLDMAEAWIDGLPGKADTGSEQCYAITRRGEDKVIGCISLMANETAPASPEIGFWVGRAHQGQGIAEEANRLLIDHAFASSAVPSIMAQANRDNAASIGLQEKLGFVYERSYDSYTPLRGRSVTLEVRWLTRADWEKSNGR